MKGVPSSTRSVLQAPGGGDALLKRPGKVPGTYAKSEHRTDTVRQVGERWRKAKLRKGCGSAQKGRRAVLVPGFLS